MLSVINSYALYVHIPWCVQKCPYCDFNSHAIKGPVSESGYLDALLQDFSQEYNEISERSLTSIFFGGGTPSTFSPDFYRQLLEQIRKLSNFNEATEITLEANPGTVDASNFSGYREAGINRLSLGFQSLQDEKLRQLGRIHDAEQAFKAFEMARSAGFGNINIDLMFALPGQSVEQALEDLEKASALKPEHISWYQLTLEPNTAFYAKPPDNLPNDELAWEIQKAGQQRLAEQGYGQYEISAYSLQNRVCRHNLNYWRFGDYVGIGAGAHGKLSRADGSVTRTTKKRHPAHYQQGEYRSKQWQLSESDLIVEYLMNKLRLKEGFTLKQMSDATGVSAGRFDAKLQQAITGKLLIKKHDIYLPTPHGHRFLNDLIALFL